MRIDELIKDRIESANWQLDCLAAELIRPGCNRDELLERQRSIICSTVKDVKDLVAVAGLASTRIKI